MNSSVPGPIAQSIASSTAYSGVVSSIPARSHTFMVIDKNSFNGHSPPLADSRSVVVSYKPMYVHEVLVNRLVKHAQEKCGWVKRPSRTTIALDWDVKYLTKQ